MTNKSGGFRIGQFLGGLLVFGLQAPGMAQGDKRFVMSNHFVKGFAVGFGLGVILMVVAVVSYFS